MTGISARIISLTCAGLLDCQRCHVIHVIRAGPQNCRSQGLLIVSARLYELDRRKSPARSPVADRTGPDLLAKSANGPPRLAEGRLACHQTAVDVDTRLAAAQSNCLVSLSLTRHYVQTRARGARRDNQVRQLQ